MKRAITKAAKQAAKRRSGNESGSNRCAKKPHIARPILGRDTIGNHRLNHARIARRKTRQNPRGKHLHNIAGKGKPDMRQHIDPKAGNQHWPSADIIGQATKKRV